MFFHIRIVHKNRPQSFCYFINSTIAEWMKHIECKNTQTFSLTHLPSNKTSTVKVRLLPDRTSMAAGFELPVIRYYPYWYWEYWDAPPCPGPFFRIGFKHKIWRGTCYSHHIPEIAHCSLLWGVLLLPWTLLELTVLLAVLQVT